MISKHAGHVVIVITYYIDITGDRLGLGLEFYLRLLFALEHTRLII